VVLVADADVYRQVPPAWGGVLARYATPPAAHGLLDRQTALGATPNPHAMVAADHPPLPSVPADRRG
jgi:hypothetical protein